MKNLIAQINWGTVNPPPGVSAYDGGSLSGISLLVSNVVRTLIVGAAVYTLFNFIFAGYSFLSASGDPKRIELATAKIWQSIIGLLIAAGSFILAAIIGQIIFNDYDALLQLRIFTP